MKKISGGILSGNQLKIIALIAMTFDHVGAGILPENYLLRIIGRIAFPIFVYMIAEGCGYTKNRNKYFLTVTGVAALCQVAYYLVQNSLYQCIFVTFSISIALIYILDKAKREKNIKNICTAAVSVVAVYIISAVLPEVLNKTDFEIDYGFIGIMLPVLIFFAENKTEKIFVMFLALVLMAISFGGIQWYSLAAVLIMLFYNGKRGKMKIKYLFYVYYPFHLVVIYFLSMKIKI